MLYLPFRRSSTERSASPLGSARREVIGSRCSVDWVFGQLRASASEKPTESDHYLERTKEGIRDASSPEGIRRNLYFPHVIHSRFGVAIHDHEFLAQGFEEIAGMVATFSEVDLSALREPFRRTLLTSS